MLNRFIKPSTRFPPRRVLLANSERRMNLLTPENPHLVHHANIETGQIINTFTFRKVGAACAYLCMGACT